MRGVPRPPNAGRKKGSLNKLTIGRMEAATAAEHPEYTYLQRQKAVATALVDRWEHTKRYTEAEGRALEALSKVLDRIMPYEHRKLSAGDKPLPDAGQESSVCGGGKPPVQGVGAPGNSMSIDLDRPEAPP